jgi:hypothetical protein
VRGRFRDLAGLRSGKLVVLERAPNAGRRPRWLCLCDCGRMTIAYGNYLRTGHTRSCGCLCGGWLKAASYLGARSAAPLSEGSL